MPDPAHQPQPDPEHNQRRTPAEQDEQSYRGPDELRDTELDDRKAAEALRKIEDVRRKLEPRG